MNTTEAQPRALNSKAHAAVSPVEAMLVERRASEASRMSPELASAARYMALGKDWSEWLAAKLGTRKWCIAARLTDRLRHKGYEKAITQKAYDAFAVEFGITCMRAELAAFDAAAAKPRAPEPRVGCSLRHFAASAAL